MRFKNPLDGGREFGQLASRPPWPSDQLTAAIGAHALQLLVSAGAAKRAFKAANARFNACVGQIDVAVFAVGACWTADQFDI